MDGSETAADQLVLKRLRWRRATWILALGPFGVLFWLAYHWAMRRFAVDEGTAYFGTMLALLAGGGLIAAAGARVAKVKSWSFAAGPVLTPHIRWLQVERATGRIAKLRILLIFTIGLATLQKGAAFIAPGGHSFADSNWSLITYLVWGLEFCWSRASWLNDELTQIRQRQATRAGYSTALLLGFCAAVYSFHHPSFAAPALPVILLVSVLACQVRMIWLERRPVPGMQHGPAPANGVQDARVRQGLTYAGLAERIGAPSRTVEAVEYRRHEPSAYLALRFAEALGTSVEALFSR